MIKGSAIDLEVKKDMFWIIFKIGALQQKIKKLGTHIDNMIYKDFFVDVKKTTVIFKVF